jgi:hypothetical protein
MAYNLWRTATVKEPAHERAADSPVSAVAVPAE